MPVADDLPHYYNELLGMLPNGYVPSLAIYDSEVVDFAVLNGLVFGTDIEKLLNHEFRMIKNNSGVNVGELAFVAQRNFDALGIEFSDGYNYTGHSLHIWGCRMEAEPYSALAWFLLDQQYSLTDGTKKFPDTVPSPESGLTFDVVAQYAQAGISDISAIRHSIDSNIDISLMLDTVMGVA